MVFMDLNADRQDCRQKKEKSLQSTITCIVFIRLENGQRKQAEEKRPRNKEATWILVFLAWSLFLQYYSGQTLMRISNQVSVAIVLVCIIPLTFIAILHLNKSSSCEPAGRSLEPSS